MKMKLINFIFLEVDYDNYDNHDPPPQLVIISWISTV